MTRTEQRPFWTEVIEEFKASGQTGSLVQSVNIQKN